MKVPPLVLSYLLTTFTWPMVLAMGVFICLFDQWLDFFLTIRGMKELSVSLTRMNGLRYSVVMDCTIQHSREQYNNKSLQPFWHQSHYLVRAMDFSLRNNWLMWIIHHLTSQHKIMAQDNRWDKGYDFYGALE